MWFGQDENHANGCFIYMTTIIDLTQLQNIVWYYI